MKALESIKEIIETEEERDVTLDQTLSRVLVRALACLENHHLRTLTYITTTSSKTSKTLKPQTQRQ